MFILLFLMVTAYSGRFIRLVSCRSCADQLWGDQNRYREVRRNAVHYIRSHRDEYIPFMDQQIESFNSVRVGKTK